MKAIKNIPFAVYLLVIWAIVIVIVNPIGDFPLNDDWAYAKSVWPLVENGEIKMVDWPAMTLFGQILWGSLFCKLFGLSFTVLRISTLVSGFFATFIFFKIASELTNDKIIAAFASLLILFNPLFFSLSFTFMTDVHFLCAFLLAYYFFAKNLKEEKLWYVVLATFFSILATLIRQPGLLVPLVFLIVGWVKNRKDLKKVFYAFLPLIITVLALILYSIWLQTVVENKINVSQVDDLFATLSSKGFNYYNTRGVTILLYAGLFLLPLSLWLLPTLKKLPIKRTIALSVLIIGIGAFLIAGSGSFPWINILYNFGLGPKTLKDTFWHENVSPEFSTEVWLKLKYIALFGTVFLIPFLFKKGIFSKKILNAAPLNHIRLLKFSLVITVCLYGLFLILNPIFFDRYTIPVIATLALLVLPYKKTRIKTAFIGGLVICFIFAWFSIEATHDYLSWNRARWKALDYLMHEQQIKPTHIDGGFEFNAWHEAGPINPRKKGRKSWWYVSDDDYVISFGPIEGFEQVKVFPFTRYLPPGKDSIHILWHQTEGARPYSFYPLYCDAETLSDDGVYFLSTQHNVEFAYGPRQSNEMARSGSYSVKLTTENRYALTSRYKEIKPGEQFIISMWRYPQNSQAGIVAASDVGKGLYIHERKNVVKKETNGWEQIELKITIPQEIDYEKVGIYVWNSGKHDLFVDDLEIARLPPEETE